MLVIVDQLSDDILVNRIEQLREESGRALFVVGILVRSSVCTGRVTLSRLLPDQLVVDGLCRGVIHRAHCLCPGAQR